MSYAVHRYVAFASLMVATTGCAHATATPACAATSAPEPSAADVTTPGWLDRESLNAGEPLALYDVQWVLKTSDQAEELTPSALHAFTLGRWECALSEERRADVLAATRLTVLRERRLVCTHASGITAQTELSCGYEAPSRAIAGAPSTAGRQSELVLADAPRLTWSCRPSAVERLQIKGNDGMAQDVCVHEGSTIAPCTASAAVDVDPGPSTTSTTSEESSDAGIDAPRPRVGEAQPSLLSP